MLVVLGLGNPGAAYRNTRHNVGYMVVDGIATGKYLSECVFGHGGSRVLRRLFAGKNMFRPTSGPFVKAEGELSGKTFMLAKSTSYMNESGGAAAWIVRKAIVKDISELLVVVDDVNLDLGRLRLREKGSDGGQKGLSHIIGRLGTDEFCRLRIGIGPRPDGEELKDYVLRSFRPEEHRDLEDVLIRASKIVGAWIEGGFQSAQREYSKQSN